MTRPQKITLGEMREMDIRGVLVYCSDYKCSHWGRISADRWPDDVRLSDLEPLFVYQAWGTRPAELRPDFEWNKPQRGRSAERPPVREGQLALSQRSFDSLPAVADFLHGFFHGRSGLAGLLCFVPSFIILPTGDTRAILLASATSSFLCLCHPSSPLFE